jgi:hypothetical protein
MLSYEGILQKHIKALDIAQRKRVSKLMNFNTLWNKGTHN